LFFYLFSAFRFRGIKKDDKVKKKVREREREKERERERERKIGREREKANQAKQKEKQKKNPRPSKTHTHTYACTHARQEKKEKMHSSKSTYLEDSGEVLRTAEAESVGNLKSKQTKQIGRNELIFLRFLVFGRRFRVVVMSFFFYGSWH
jgi:hypothetical protein